MITSGLNTYDVTNSEHPTSPYADIANICKHVLFILLNSFKVKEGDYRHHQKALTKSEVEDLFTTLDLKSLVGTKTTNVAIFNAHKKKKKQVWQVREISFATWPQTEVRKTRVSKTVFKQRHMYFCGCSIYTT